MTMRWVMAVLAIGLLLATGAPAEAGSLANLIPNLFGADGIVLAPPGGAPRATRPTSAWSRAAS